MRKKAEILAPAGSFESVRAAVYSGCDAVYLGAKDFNARRNASNFGFEELCKTVSFCHERGVSVHQALNTLVFDDEMDRVCRSIEEAAKADVDALIVQDLGVADLARKICPEMELHGSTQMSVHTLDGVMELARLGFSRAVLARECSYEQIRYICEHSPIEIEVFIHGALCMSVSGQCTMSAMIGGRSGNRGLCAQPCRLPFCANNGAYDKSRYDLSLKDLSHIEYLGALYEAGVSSFKIEGRMKRPEYVACAVACCYQMREYGHIDPELSQMLRAVFSRSGFTDGYYRGIPSPAMFGTRQKEDVTAASDVFSRLHELYKKEMARVGVSMQFTARAEQPCVLCCMDEDGNTVKTQGDFPQAAKTKAADETSVRRNLEKTGGTPYRVDNFCADLEDGLFFPASALNELRRSCLAELSAIRGKRTEKPCYPFKEESGCKNTSPVFPVLRAQFLKISQIPDEVSILERIYLPVQELFVHRDTSWVQEHLPVLCAVLPRACFEREEELEQQLATLKKKGISRTLVHNLGDVARCRRLGFQIEGGFSLNLTNSRAFQAAAEMGICEAVVSFETPLECIRSLVSPLPVGVMVYGHLPLMLVRNCPLKNVTSCGKCQREGYHLTDRMGNHFAVSCSYGASEIYNPKVLWLAERLGEFSGVHYALLLFTTEEKERCGEILRAYQSGTRANEEYTRGLYYRRVQ